MSPINTLDYSSGFNTKYSFDGVSESVRSVDAACYSIFDGISKEDDTTLTSIPKMGCTEDAIMIVQVEPIARVSGL